jgi:MFS family permease
MAFCSLYGFWAVITWGPTFIQTERGLGLGVAGAYTALVAVAAIPAALLLGRFSDRFGRRRLALLLLPLAAACILLLSRVQTLEALVIALVAYGLTGKLALDPVTVAWLGDRVAATEPQAIGAVMGVFSFSGMSSAVVAPLISGWVKDTTGSLEGALVLAAALVLVGTVFAALAGEASRRPSG